MEDLLNDIEEKMEKSIDNMLHKFSQIRAGRANPSILDGIKVPCYGTETPLNQVATISIPEATQLAIKPFDKNILGDIEKAIFQADLGLTPNNNGNMIYIVFPPLTEERRKTYVKEAKRLAEEAKIAIRNIRQDAKNSIKNDELSEDQEEVSINNIQELVDSYNEKVEKLLEEKEKELMSV